MSKENKNKEDYEQQYNKLKEQYNSLLQKNQNDLIKIRQKEKTFNETIQSLKQQRQSMQQKLKTDINTLIQQVQKLRNGVRINDLKNESIQKNNKKQNEDLIQSLKEEIQSLNKQNSVFKQIIESKKDRVESLQQNSRKLIDENINLTASNTQLEDEVKLLQDHLNLLMKKNEQLNKQLESKQNSEISKKQMNQTQQQTQLSNPISQKQQQILIEQFNKQIKQLIADIQVKDDLVLKLKQRLKETNEQLKRFMQRDKKNTVLLKKKGQQLETITLQIENVKKVHKNQRKRIITEDSCTKCKQWEQQNKLLKQMVKSVQTMVRVREMQAERYKNRDALNSSKIYDRSPEHQTKRSKAELPPLQKKF